MCNLVNQCEELSDKTKFWQGNSYRLQRTASDILCVCPWTVSGVHTPHAWIWTQRCRSRPCLLASPAAGPPRQHIPLALQWRPGENVATPTTACLFLYTGFFTYLNLQSRGKRQIMKLSSGIPSLNCGNLPLLCRTCPYPQPDQNTAIKTQNPKTGQGQRPLQRLQWSWAKCNLLFCVITLLCHSLAARNDAAASLRNLLWSENCKIAKSFLF